MARYGNYARRGKTSFLSRFRNKITVGLVAKITFFSLVIGSVFVFAAFAIFSSQLPNPNEIQRDRGFSTQILARDEETVLFDVYEEENRQFTPIDEVPEYLRQATIAIEDKDFYEHGGFSVLGMIRGALRVFTKGRAAGGSTLTQQLVKNVLLTSERRISRKLKELVLAVQIERGFTKDEILQMYLNEIPYGGTSLGIAAAAHQYFGKDPKDLDLTEAVILAGIPQAPTRYSPYGSNPLAYVDRATSVARRMREDGYITKEQEEEVVNSLTEVKFQPAGISIKAPHFVMYVREQLNEMYGEDYVNGAGLKVITSIDSELQEEAQEIVSEEILDVADSLHITNGASVTMNSETGEILSMVGSRNFFDEDIDGQVNVSLSLRQPGSSIKPVTYATAFKEGLWPGKVLADVVTEFPGGDGEKYEPVNYDGEERGYVHLREALASSLNVPAVKLLALVGVQDMLETAYDMGFTTLEPTKENRSRFGLSVTLGGGEVRLLDSVTAYSAFSNGGYRVEPVSILRVEDREGKVLFEHKQPGRKRVLDEKVAFLINNILSDNNARLLTFGVNSLINIRGANVAVKTGTTNDLRDNWTVGWTGRTVVGVWVGNNDNSPMKNVASGVSGASPIWRRQMLEVIDKYGDPEFGVPGGVSQVELDKISGYPAHDGFESYTEWAINGTVPSEKDPIHQQFPVCSGDPSKKASAVMIAQGNYETREYVVMREEDPLTQDDLWQKAIDKWLEGNTDPLLHPPTEACGDVNGVHVEILNPGNEVRIDSNSIEVRATVFSDKPIEWVDLYIDGSKELRWEEGPYRKDYTLSDGKHEIRVVARNTDGVESDRVNKIGVNVDWNEPDPTPNP